MIDALDLQKDEERKQKVRKKLYEIEIDRCLSVIKFTHSQGKTTCLYEVPESVLGEPFYNWEECTQFIKSKLVSKNFYVRIATPGNRLFISWDPVHTKHVKKQQKDLGIDTKAEKEKEKELQKDMCTDKIIEFVPSSALSNLHFRTTLMKDNPKYAHLKKKR